MTLRTPVLSALILPSHHLPDSLSYFTHRRLALTAERYSIPSTLCSLRHSNVPPKCCSKSANGVSERFPPLSPRLPPSSERLIFLHPHRTQTAIQPFTPPSDEGVGGVGGGSPISGASCQMSSVLFEFPSDPLGPQIPS